MNVLKEHKEDRMRSLRRHKIFNISISVVYTVAIIVGILKASVLIVAFLLILMLASVLQIWCIWKISNQMKEMKQILPNTRVFVIHTFNSVINTLNWGVMTYALIALSYRRPGSAFDWVHITDPISAQYVTAFLICFIFAFILCFCNVCMFM